MSEYELSWGPIIAYCSLSSWASLLPPENGPEKSVWGLWQGHILPSLQFLKWHRVQGQGVRGMKGGKFT